MKISVCGKGGSGKSTLTTLLAGQAVERGLNVLVPDDPIVFEAGFAGCGLNNGPAFDAAGRVLDGLM